MINYFFFSKTGVHVLERNTVRLLSITNNFIEVNIYTNKTDKCEYYSRLKLSDQLIYQLLTLLINKIAAK